MHPAAASFPLTERTLYRDCLSDPEEEEGAAAAGASVPELHACLAVQTKQVVRLEGVVQEQAGRIGQASTAACCLR